jgi:hypothetical protein
VLNPEGLAELGNDFTGKYIMERIASQVTVLKMYQSNGLWKGTEEKNQCQNPHPWSAKGCGTRSYFCGSMCDPRRPSISAPPARKLIHRESFRASVLHHSEIHAVLESIAVRNCLLTTPSLLSKATPSCLLIYFSVIPLRVRHPPAALIQSARRSASCGDVSANLDSLGGNRLRKVVPDDF